MEVYKCGSKATTVSGKIKGIATAILIRFGKIQYEFVYFNDGKRQSEWMEQCELEFDKSAEQITIGYK